MLLLSVNFQDVPANGKTPCERRFGDPLKWPTILFGATVEYHPTSPKDQARIHHFGKKVLLGIFLGYELVGCGIWKGDFLTADLEDWERLGASGIYPRRIKVKEVLISQKR